LAFGLPAALMLIATIVFVAGSAMYVKKPPSSDASSLKVIKVIASATLGKIRSLFGRCEKKSTWLEYADMSKYSREFVHETKIVLGILTVFAPISLFWALYDQQGSRWTYQAIMMNGNLGPISIKPEQMGVFNAILILVLIPAFDRVIYPILGQLGVSLQPLAKIFWGMALAALSFVLAALLQFYIESKGVFVDNPIDTGTVICESGCVHVLWQVPQYFILTCGEVMLSITGLEFAYSQAPESMKAVCSAAWLLTVATGNLVVIFFNELDPVSWIISSNEMVWNFLFWSGVLGIGTLVFALMASKYKYVCSDELRTVASEEGADELEEKNLE
jgi:dipeptide/tripeptide permease